MGNELTNWNPDQNWGSKERKISWRNLFISIPALTAAFVVWSMWGVLTVLMQSAGFPFTNDQLFLLMSVSGFTGATLRIPSTFMVKLAGGRNTIFITTVFILIPLVGIGIGLQSLETPFSYFVVMALLTGIGGGNFASSMANIGPFFPRSNQGMALGLNAGVGNLGVTLAQLLIPIAVTVGVVGEPHVLKMASGSLLGVLQKGSDVWLQNGSYIWVVLLIPLIIAIYFGMNNLIASNIFKSAVIILPMLFIGFVTSALGLFMMKSGLTQWVVMPLIIIITVLALKYIPGDVGKNVTHQYQIFKNKHTWIIGILYIMTFGSFIGFSAVFPLAINIIFGHSHILSDAGVLTSIPNPKAPNTLSYAWLGPFIGAIARPVGGIIADKLGGSRVTAICSSFMLVSAVILAHYMKLAYHSATPEIYFPVFLAIFLVLFLMTGLGNGSTFRSAAVIFNKEQSGAVTGWISALAAYGSFFIPQIISNEIRNGTPEVALYGFAIFYGICVLICFWCYLRPGSELKNP